MQPLGEDEPTAVGPYRLLGRLGSGGMGRVYLGRSVGGRTVAVKIVHPHLALDEEFRARFRREVEAARRVGGAWTAPVLDADPEAAVPWVATGYVAGPSLAAAVASGGGPLPEHSVRVLGAGLGEALATVHALGLVHRDVKPSNVLLTVDGPLLIDFGIARAIDGTASLTSTGVSVGSPGYMAPEQILGQGASGAADVFSLGAVLAFAATGRPPFPGDSSAALLYRVVHEAPELGAPRGALRGELRAVVEACLVKDPAARPAPAELAARLAPQGAAALVASGWLPGPLVAQVGRSAVHLLNLEGTASGPSLEPTLGSSGEGQAEAGREAVTGSGSGSGSGPIGGAREGGGASPSASGPVQFSSPAVRSGEPSGTSGEPRGSGGGPTGPVAASSSGPGSGFAASAGGASAFPGEFGPPPVMDRVLAAPGDAPAAVPVPVPRDAEPTVGGGGRPGRVSVTVAAAATPGEGGRGRRLSCSVALAVAGALAAVTVGSVFLYRLLPTDGDHDSASGSDARSSPSAAAGTPAPSEGGTPAALPARYVGTWEGQGTGLDGSLPMGTFRVTVQRADVGQKLGELRQTDVLGGVCLDVLTLKRVTEKEVVATSVGAKSNHGGCNPTAHTIRLTPTGDDLTYASDSPAEGNPVARMSRVD
ncbi:serine/threonine protein kinase [Streptomyces humidus]|uniref:Serine/threonine protein kinase n=1 Tax=Streptomyces humidus TaxID=52259 RepID=A0A918L6L9_9ACTN|nr:serine/threonine-protein kinase [Streptomyces humidus]GGS12250.1 serine/threonine protein kinase [Streptomyces humidus]